jgi:exopolyphosphatase/guanosine-5'-triphosphate,3'-diphosphate pyrophosphatase
MVVARVDQGHVLIVDRLREMVRLASGLDGAPSSTPRVRNARLPACVSDSGCPCRLTSARVVGTNTLRRAQPGDLLGRG